MIPNERNPRTRPVFKLAAIDDQEKFKPLPAPTGTYPYRLNINKLIPAINDDHLSFQMAGDTGELNTPEYQSRVISALTDQCNANNAQTPQFFFHLGDIVYNYGQASEYYRQFFNAWRKYPCPIFAIAGNHDADIDPFQPDPPQSLDAFMSVFCSKKPGLLEIAGNSGRKTNIQPNVYWVLETPMADIIGLYSNVPRFGNVQQDQKAWFIEALKIAAANQKAIIVCLHHSAYSADTNHGSSIHMQMLIDGAIRETGIYPDVVFSGHVHNYQRFHKYYPGGQIVPFIVAGGGGYAGLHSLAQPDDPKFPDKSFLLDDVVLQNYCDNEHGFLKVDLCRTMEGVSIEGQYFTTDTGETVLFDNFSIQKCFKAHIVPSESVI